MSSDSTASGVAFFSPSFSISRFHPNAQTINPPPTWTAGSDTPKNASRCEPRKYEPAIKAKLFKVTRQDSSRRVVGETSRVSARKIGLALSGSTIGNSALNTRKKAFISSCILSLRFPCPTKLPGRRFFGKEEEKIGGWQRGLPGFHLKLNS